ncbi:SpoVK/Ycf46/Vps4 family AAA+-type ATPase [Azospirillum fermentarium]|uniref:ATP-binding protein n=1 Tax=Azospirillum fermentarium TaxID=1233114 RepID=UPI0022272CB8|nr:ATP-binding protein [Azospirillum fermentarium]MCW2247734.1 SpoVK/Ycf46/Vps4 family AAA+-type ATPase [Azospirillum fermentarium]
MTGKPLDLRLDLGPHKDEALAFRRVSGAVTLRDFLTRFAARTMVPIADADLDRPLRDVNVIPVAFGASAEPALAPVSLPPAPDVRAQLDGLFNQDKADTSAPNDFPAGITDNEAVRIAYRRQLDEIAKHLKHDFSVLVVCDKILTGLIYEHVCQRAGKSPVLDTQNGEDRQSERDALRSALQGSDGAQSTLPTTIRNLKDNQVLVLRSVDLFDKPQLIETLYQTNSGGRLPQIFGFLDPSLEVKKVLTDRFAVHISMVGLPRYLNAGDGERPVHAVNRLITADEHARFEAFDPEDLYKNVSGLNVIQFRNAMRFVGATVAPGSDTRHIFDVIRQFKTSSTGEIEIPDISFENIGGYDHVKQELKRMIDLVAGRVPGLSEQQRERLIPKGFIFHGPPGTGKTLFAKAIANEMNATIQMISGPEIMDKYVGQSESNLRHIFATARRNAPSVIFFDEFDSIASQRSSYSDGSARANNAVVAQLLTELDGFRGDQSVFVIGTTNRLDIIDEALLRPSRLRPIEIGLPDYFARRSVASIHAETFGINRAVKDLWETLAPLASASADGAETMIQGAVLDSLFTRYPALKARYEAEAQSLAITRELQGVLSLMRASATEAAEAVPGLFGEVEERLRQIGLPSATLSRDISDLLELTRTPSGAGAAAGPEGLITGLLDLVAEYTEGFNNDEIRAIFQEASMEMHMDGQLITPRHLGIKIGLIRKRRDERQVVHLTAARGRR